jgi:hypothetical protein
MNIVPQTELPELKAAGRSNELCQTTRIASTTAVVRRGLVICIAAMLLSLGFAVRYHINAIDAEMEMIRANLLRPVIMATK